jgi:hypothetical protein
LYSGLFVGLGAVSFGVSGGSTYINPTCFNGFSPTDTTGNVIGIVVPSPGTLRNLNLVTYISTMTAPSASLQAQVWVNSVGTSLTCTATFSTAGLHSCSDTVDAVGVNAGDVVSTSMMGSISSGVANITSMLVAVEK